MTIADRAHFIRRRLPKGGLFAGHDWRIAPHPFPLDAKLVRDLEWMGRILHQFNRALNRLYRHSLESRQPAWVARAFDQGKPDSILKWQRHPGFKNQFPRVIRPDLLLTDEGFRIMELDSVPGGIGLTAWLNQSYSDLAAIDPPASVAPNPNNKNSAVIGGPRGMIDGFASIFGNAPNAHIAVSDEAATYRPEMQWLAEQLGPERFAVRDAHFTEYSRGDAVYRFFELFDLPNLPNANRLFQAAAEGEIQVTAPPKPLFEEKLAFALLWNGNLRDFWRRELGEKFFQRMLEWTPESWLVDPSPIPPHAAIPRLDLTNWQELKSLSQRERELVLKVSGFSENAWGSRGVYIGSDMAADEWAKAVDLAISSFERSPFVLQRFSKARALPSPWFDFAGGNLETMLARVRLCPYYFVAGDADHARPHLGGVLATICPADKKIIHGMKEAVLAPCHAVSEEQVRKSKSGSRNKSEAQTLKTPNQN